MGKADGQGCEGESCYVPFGERKDILHAWLGGTSQRGDEDHGRTDRRLAISFPRQVSSEYHTMTIYCSYEAL